MNRRPAVAVLAAVALPLTLVSAPAQALSLAGAPGKPTTSESVTGTVVRINTKANRIRLEDRSRVKYDANDALTIHQWYDVVEEDRIACELRDTGGEEWFERLLEHADDDVSVLLSGAVYADKEQESLIFLYANTCDGVVDALDTLTPSTR